MKKEENKVVEFITENQVKAMVGEANASLMLNPTVAWAKFILTDNLPNGNNQRVPTEEFDNLILSGLHMPIKMAEGKIDSGHDNSKPLGVITHLKKEKDPLTNADIIVALAALWANERPSDVAYVRELMDAGEDVNVSWELGYRDSTVNESGVEDFIDVVLKAVTLVTKPAYQGRTRFLSVAAKAEMWSTAYNNSLPDSSFLFIESSGELDASGRTYPRSLRHFPVLDTDGNADASRLNAVEKEIKESSLQATVLDTALGSLEKLRESLATKITEDVTEDYKLKTLEQLEQENLDLQKKLDETLKSLEDKNKELEDLKTSSASLLEEKEELEKQLAPLQEFKNEAEEEKAKAEKLLSIKEKFDGAGVAKENDYFESNKDFLLGLDDSALDFMLQELASFPKLEEGAGEAGLKPRVPRIQSNDESVTVQDIVKALKDRKAK